MDSIRIKKAANVLNKSLSIEEATKQCVSILKNQYPSQKWEMHYLGGKYLITGISELGNHKGEMAAWYLKKESSGFVVKASLGVDFMPR